MNERVMAEDNKILEIVAGSWLYGTANPETSDKDYVGIFLPNVEYILGFKKCEEVDFSIKDKDESGKNTKNALDRKLYEFRHYIKLALQNNPNILEILFANKESVIYVNEIGKELLKIKHLFPYRGCKERFLGYAFSQKRKMIIKKDNYFDLISALDFLGGLDHGKYMAEVVASKCPPFIKTSHDEAQNCKFVCVGDINILPSKTVGSAMRMIQDRVDKAGNREELLLKYGFDTKFASHLIRLMVEGVDLLKNGHLEFPLKEAKMILDIKTGKWTISEILNYSNELEKEIESLAETSKLPAKPNTEILEKFTVDTLREWLMRESI